VQQGKPKINSKKRMENFKEVAQTKIILQVCMHATPKVKWTRDEKHV